MTPSRLAVLFCCTGCINVESGAKSDARTLTISGTAELEVVPDQASVEVTFATTDKQMRAAHLATQQAVERFLAELDKVGVPRSRTTLGGIVYNPNFVYPDDKPQKLVSFTASLVAVVQTGDFAQLPAIIDTAVNAGAQSVEGVQFFSSRLPELKKQVRDKAIEATREKALQLARGLGAELGAINSVSEMQWNAHTRPRSGLHRYDDYGANIAVQASIPAPAAAEPSEGPMHPGSYPMRLSIEATYALE